MSRYLMLALGGAVLAGCSPPEPSTALTSDSGVEKIEGSDLLRNAIAYGEFGKWQIEPKIFGGVEAKSGADPWQVALIVGAQQPDQVIPFCGGSIVSPRWIVTAAHCVDNNTRPAQVDVFAGQTDLDQPGKRLKLAEIIVHKSYDPVSMDNDVALLRLTADAPGGAIRVSNQESLARPGSLSRVTGWGRTENSSGTVRKLRTLDVPIVSRTDCNDAVSYNGAITNNMLCAGREAGGQDSCQGDSGGPLSVPAGTDRLLVGVVSWGQGCALPNKYGVYTSLANYESQISACISGPTCALQ